MTLACLGLGLYALAGRSSPRPYLTPVAVSPARHSENTREKEIDDAVAKAQLHVLDEVAWNVFGTTPEGSSTSGGTEVLKAAALVLCRDGYGPVGALKAFGPEVSERVCSDEKAAGGMKSLSGLADHGDLNAATALAYIYNAGARGVQRNALESLKWGALQPERGFLRANALLEITIWAGKVFLRTIEWHWSGIGAHRCKVTCDHRTLCAASITRNLRTRVLSNRFTVDRNLLHLCARTFWLMRGVVSRRAILLVGRTLRKFAGGPDASAIG